MRATATFLALAVALAAFLGVTAGVTAAADGATLRIVTTSPTVVHGGTFTIRVVQNAPGPTSGTQATVTFDKTRAQIQTVTRGSAHLAAPIFAPADMKGAIASANATGKLRTVATDFFPPATVPAGDQDFLIVKFKATGCGVVPLGLPVGPYDAVMLDGNADTYGNTLAITTTGASVKITGCVEPTPSASPTSNATPTEPTDEGGPTPTPAFATVQIVPQSPQVAIGASVTVDVRINTAGDVGNIVSDLTFDNTLLQIQKVAPGPLWNGATVRAGMGTLDVAIAQANSTGLLPKVNVVVPLGIAQPSDGQDGAYLSVTMKGIANGTSDLALTGLHVNDPDGQGLGVSATTAHLVVGSGGTVKPAPGSNGASGSTGEDSTPTLIAGALLALVLLGALLLIVWSRRRGRPGRRGLSYLIPLLLGLIPVLMFFGLVAVVVINALPAFTDPGLGGMLSDKYASQYTMPREDWVYGLFPAVAGTILVTGIAMLLALPVSLAMAIISTEFPMGPVGRVVRPLVGLLSGIPPIVYAVSVLLFVQAFMIPKFAADSTWATFQNGAAIGATNWPPAGVPYSPGSYPWAIQNSGGNSILLGSILIALLLIPFITPMIADAIRNVPTSSREASLALGANRSYTLRKAILPMALPGIATALILGFLKALGDVVIVSFAVGWEAGALPNPIFDVFERVPTLAAHGANEVSLFEESGGAGGIQPGIAVGFVCALLLLFVAGAMVLLMNVLKARWRRRMGA